MTVHNDVAKAITEEIRRQNVDPFSNSRYTSIAPPIDWNKVANAAVKAAGTIDVYAVIERAEQACRYMLKHNEDRWSREERSEDYAKGFKIACELCAEAIRPHVMRHEGEAVITLARRFMDFIAWSGNIATDQVVRLRKEFETEFDPGKPSHVEDLERKIALVMAHDSNLIDHLERHAEK